MRKHRSSSLLRADFSRLKRHRPPGAWKATNCGAHDLARRVLNLRDEAPATGSPPKPSSGRFAFCGFATRWFIGPPRRAAQGSRVRPQLLHVEQIRFARFGP